MVIDRTDEFVAKIANTMRRLSREETLQRLRQYPNPVQIAVIDLLDATKPIRKIK
jgi:hypothetical protein